MKRRDLHGRLEKVEGQIPTPPHDPEREQHIAQLEELEQQTLARARAKANDDPQGAWRDCLRAEVYQVSKWRLQGKTWTHGDLHSSQWGEG